MAGAGFKTFASGEVLTAANVNTYLMQQTVMVFADSSARSTALGANVSEGMLSYLKDTNKVEVYDGSSWVASDDPNAIQNTIVDAKGDLISATAADTPARLASSGVNGEVLTIDTSTATGLKWAAASGWNPNFQLLNSGGTSLSGSSTSISGISGKNALMVYFTGASTTNTGGYIRFTLNNDTSTDIYNYYQIGRITSTVQSNSGPNTFVNLGRLTTNDATTSVSGIFWIYGTNASGYKVISGTTYNTSTATASAAWSFTGYYAGTSTISSIQMVTDDTFDAGTVYVYGA